MRFGADLCTGSVSTSRAIPGSTLHAIDGAPHGCNVSHAPEINGVLIDFLSR